MATPINTQTRASDRPIDDADHDDFQRDPFALRIAQTLIDRRSEENIVIGLYGKWGEGKSSVLNLIKKSLLKVNDKVIFMTFNPWRFPDESQLINYFFNQLAQEIEKAMPPTQNAALVQDPNWLDKTLERGQKKFTKPLQTKGETLAELFATYSKPFTGLVGIDLSEVIGGHLPDLEELRNRIEAKIQASGKRVIVIIDDIDRLEKKQIQAIFRLVKLTADFKQTAYLLAFDDEMVARAIGEMFESGDNKVGELAATSAGHNFLEKIIQVPLRLPLANPNDLLDFCWARLTEALNDSSTSLDANEREHLADSLRSAILSRLTTPRQAVRYANAVQFGLPLLQGEVNTVDQLLVEAMHIFFPQLHQFVATHETAFAGSLQSDRFYFLAGEGNTVDEKHKQLVDDVLKNYTGDDHRAAMSLLCTLFPRINKLYNGNIPWMGSNRITDDTLTKRKAVAAVTHFARYFAYAIVTGDVSDGEFDTFLHASLASQLATAESLITRLGASLFLQKIQYQVQAFTPEQAKSLWSMIVEFNQYFKGEKGPFSQNEQAAKLLLGLLFQVVSSDERRHLVEHLIQSQATFDFAKELFYKLRIQRQKETQSVGYGEDGFVLGGAGIFGPEEWQKLIEKVLPQLFLERALAEAGSVPIYKSHQRDAYELLFSVWPNSERQLDVVAYINHSLAQSAENIHDLLAACSSPIGRGASEYMANMPSNRVRKLVDLFGSSLYDVGRQVLGSEQVPSYPGEDPAQPSPQDRLRQFIYLYENLENFPATTQEQ